MLYQDLQPSATKSNRKFEILVVKVISLKQKANQILSATIDKIKFCLFKKTATLFSESTTLAMLP